MRISGKAYKSIFNLFLIFTTAGFLWYVMQPKNLVSDKLKNNIQSSQSSEIPFTELSYRLDYSNHDPLTIENISLFGEEEKWHGSGFFDKDLYSEYPTSLNLAGSGKNNIVVTKNVALNLSKILNFDLALYYKSNPTYLEKGELFFLDNNKNKTSFVLPKLDGGWNFIDIPKEQFNNQENFNWAAISSAEFSFTPRPLTSIALNLGSLRGQAGQIVHNDWNSVNKKMLLLDKRNGEIGLLVRNISGAVATIKKITSVTNFIFQCSYRPLSTSAGGIFFRGNYENGQGYYFTLGGINSNGWQLYKIGQKGTETLAKGNINNFKFQFQDKYHLKIETKMNNIKTYFSNDGEKYVLLTSVNDNEFTSGGVGVAVSPAGVSLFNDFIFNQ
jgi:hypothetical protein